jgi:hypothetical protein
MSEVWVSKEDGFDGCALFSCDASAETLTHSEPDEAIEEWADDVEDLTGTVTVYGYTRRVMDPTDPDPDMILERELERLDDEYGGGDDPTEATDAMKQAAKVFAAVIRDEYRVWQCEPTHKAVVNVEAWAREHRPDWLEAKR